MKTQLSLLFVVSSASLASAGGFNVNEHDAKATGRAGAVAASDTDPSAMVYNPGGLAVASGTNFALDGTLYMANGNYTLDGTTDKVSTDTSPAFAPSVFVTSRVHDMIAIGIGLHFPFGSTISWPSDHPQSDIIEEQSLRTYFITPTVGLNLDKQVPGLSIGAGLDLVPATVELQQAVIFGDTRGTAHLGGDAFGIGGRAGVMYHPGSLKELKLGLMWRSRVKLDFAGNGDFDIADPYRSQLPPDGDISTTIRLPQQVTFGVAYAPMPQLELEVNAVWMDWSTFDRLAIELPGDVETVTPENYHDTLAFRIGGEYKLEPQNAALRAGFIYDPTPIPSTTLTATLPDADRRNITVGGSKYFGKYGAHLGLLWVTPNDRKTSDAMYTPMYKGTYGISAFVISAMLSGQI